jgi:hypothetical protein
MLHPNPNILPPRPRTLWHPGRLNPVRINSRQAESATHVRLLLEPGMSLHDGLVGPLSELQLVSASTTILGGFFDCIDYCVAPPDPEGRAVIAYSAPIHSGPAYLVFGNATLGVAKSGAPLVHCHAAVRTESGSVRGGHLLTERCIVGRKPISVLVTGFAGLVVRQAHDPETNILLFQPFGDADHV